MLASVLLERRTGNSLFASWRPSEKQFETVMEGSLCHGNSSLEWCDPG